MLLYLAVQSTPTTFEIGIFSNNYLIDKITEDKRYTSKLFIPLLEQLLCKNAIVLSDLSFCAVHCGPAPFSTLRSIIASANGLHCASNIPLISIDGLEATFWEFRDTTQENTIVLLNAFNNESYYLLAHNIKIIATGYKQTDLLRADIKKQFPEGNIAIIDNEICSLETIGRIGYEKYSAHQAYSEYLSPLYLKKHPVEL